MRSPNHTSADEIVVKGRVVDEHGQPVAKARVGSNWSPLGWFDEHGKRHAIGDANAPEDLEKWHRGAMQPNNNGRQTVTDDNGLFLTRMTPTQSLLLAFDESGERSGMADFDPQHLTNDVVIRLFPAIDVSGRMVLKSTGEPPKWSVVCIEAADSPANPLAFRRFTSCWSVNGEFQFKLPPGRYELACNIDSTDYENMIRSEPRIIKLSDKTRHVNVGDMVLGSIELTRDNRIETAKKENRAVEVKELLGKPMPSWSITDARGMESSAGPKQYQGKWVLVYFWHYQCGPCAGKEVPRLSKFVVEQTTGTEKFAVVSFMLGGKYWKSIADADQFVEPIAKRYWTQPWTKLPQAFDNSDRTRERVAEELFGQWVLIDPNGIVTATGDDTAEGIIELKTRAGL